MSGPRNDERRSSPSVMTSTPAASCCAMASSMARSSIHLNSAGLIRPSCVAARASFSHAGRSREPMTSALTTSIQLLLQRSVMAAGRPHLKDVFQSKLHNPWIVRLCDLTKGAAIECSKSGDALDEGPHAIGDIESLPASFHGLVLTDPEEPAQGGIQFPEGRPCQIVDAVVSVRSQRRSGERGWV